MSASDDRVWELAIEHGCVLVTKDEDFHRLSVLRGAPPKVIWIRLGNSSTEEVANLLLRYREAVSNFAGQDEASFLGLG